MTPVRIIERKLANASAAYMISSIVTAEAFVFRMMVRNSWDIFWQYGYAG